MLNKPIVLASASPRRKQLLESVDIDFICVPSKIEEVFNTNKDIAVAIEDLAFQKASDVANAFPNAIVIGADTMVVCNGQVLGKPKNEEDARTMLHMLSANTHQVISGVAIISKEKTIVFHETSAVTFYSLDQDIIDWYIASEEAYDKAGAYGIQGKASIFVEKINGDYFNIVGLPLAKVYRYLKEIQTNKE